MNITCIPAIHLLSTIDLDGDGPNLPDVTVVGKFKIGVEYTGV